MTTEWTIRRFAPATKNGTPQWHITDAAGDVVAGPRGNLLAVLEEFPDAVLIAFDGISKEVTEA